MGKYHGLYVQSATSLLADVLNKLRNMCLEIYQIDPDSFFTAPGLAWEATLKKSNIKLDILIYTDMLLMVEKGIRGGACHASLHTLKKYLKNYEKNNEPSYLKYWDSYNLCG